MSKINLFSLAAGAAFVVSGCGGGIPSCDDGETKKIVENIFKKIRSFKFKWSLLF